MKRFVVRGLTFSLLILGMFIYSMNPDQSKKAIKLTITRLKPELNSDKLDRKILQFKDHRLDFEIFGGKLDQSILFINKKIKCIESFNKYNDYKKNKCKYKKLVLDSTFVADKLLAGIVDRMENNVALLKGRILFFGKEDKKEEEVTTLLLRLGEVIERSLSHYLPNQKIYKELLFKVFSKNHQNGKYCFNCTTEEKKKKVIGGQQVLPNVSGGGFNDKIELGNNFVVDAKTYIANLLRSKSNDKISSDCKFCKKCEESTKKPLKEIEDTIKKHNNLKEKLETFTSSFLKFTGVAQYMQ